MEYINNTSAASESNLPPQTKLPQHSVKNDSDTEDILSLVNKLKFNVNENDKQQFFEELESVMTSEIEQDDSSNYHELINFFIKHTNSDGKISK